MIQPGDIAKVLEGYDPKNIRIGSLGGHSALDVCRGAKAEGFETVVVVQKGREKTYSQYYKKSDSCTHCSLTIPDTELLWEIRKLWTSVDSKNNMWHLKPCHCCDKKVLKM